MRLNPKALLGTAALTAALAVPAGAFAQGAVQNARPDPLLAPFHMVAAPFAGANQAASGAWGPASDNPDHFVGSSPGLVYGGQPLDGEARPVGPRVPLSYEPPTVSGPTEGHAAAAASAAPVYGQPGPSWAPASGYTLNSQAATQGRIGTAPSAAPVYGEQPGLSAAPATGYTLDGQGS